LDEARANRIDNQIETTFKTFQALTVSCARCHDHKFDAISQRDYYALFGILQSSRFIHRSIEATNKNAAVLRRMDDLRGQIRQAVATQWRTLSGDAGSYLKAARELFVAGAPGWLPTMQPDQTFHDFGRNGYEGWQIEGEAFSHGPVSLSVINTFFVAANPENGPNLNTGATTTMACSHPIGKIAPGEPATLIQDGHRHRGTLTSRRFTLSHRYMQCRIAGDGNDQTALEVIVDGNVAARGPVEILISSAPSPSISVHGGERPLSFDWLTDGLIPSTATLAWARSLLATNL